MEGVRAIETRCRPGRPHAPLVEGLLPRWTRIAPRDSAGTKDPFRPSDRRVWGFESEERREPNAHAFVLSTSFLLGSR